MSDTQADELARAEMALRINRMVNESLKYQAEQQKLLAEQQKMLAEQQKQLAEREKLGAQQGKLVAEGARYDRDRWLAPVLAIVTVIGAVVAGVASVLNLIFHH
jgi:hypothetical protein